MTDMSLSQTLVFGHLWQSVAIAAVLAAALIIGKRMRGGTRYGLGAAALLASLALPFASFIPGETIVAGLLKQMNAPVSLDSAAPTTHLATLPISEIAARAAPAPAAAPRMPVNYNEASLGYVSSALAPAAAPAAPVGAVKASAPPSLFTLPQIPMPDIGLPLLIIWLGVAAVLIGRTIRDLIAVERLVARAKPADLPKALQARMQGVRVVVSPEAPGPMAAGLLHPAIVLPESIALASPGMAALLEHEHAHIRRRDMLAALGQRVVLALLWWSPALYWISRRMDEEREVACDEAAVDRTGDARAFARSLTTQAENQLWVRAPRLAVGAIGPRSQFSRRIRRLIDIAKTGGSPAKYSGRLAFAGLAVVVGVAAMVTPRFTADAQQTQDKPIDLTSKNAAAKDELNAAEGKLDGAAAGSHDDAFNWDSKDWDGKDFAGLGKEIEAMMAELAPQLKALGAEFGPEMQNEFAGLSTEMAGLGIDISSMITQDVMAEMPRIMEEVRRSLEEAGIDPDHMDEMKGLSAKDAAEVRAAMQQARDEMKHALGPELQAEIRASLAQARDEIASHRDEIAAAMDAARARGDFKVMGKDGKISFDFGPEVMEQLRAAGVNLDLKGTKINFNGHRDRSLIEAADQCDVSAINKLLADGKNDANMLIPGMGTALMAATDSECLDAARVLINAGADVNRGFPGNGTPLQIAVDHDNKAFVDLLLSRGANPNASSPGMPGALFQAIDQGNLDIVKALVGKGANINLKSPMSGMRTPLDAAIDEGQDEIVDFLRSKGATESDKHH
ncbi:MAG: M56 family metallopeptidase [Hyphomonadaceae bacterium]